MLHALITLFVVCASLREATCLMRNIKPVSLDHRTNVNATLTPRDLFGRQSCNPGYGLCDSGSCCPLDDSCCGYGCAPGDAVCCGDSGNCPAGDSCCTYNCAPSGWGCCDTGYAAPLDADCCGDGGYCPSGTYCVDCDDGSEGCCNAPYSVSSYFFEESSTFYIPTISSFPTPSSSPYPSFSEGGVSSSYGGGGIAHYQYYYTIFTYWYVVWYLTTTTSTTTVASTTTTTSTRLSIYASNSQAAERSFSSLENYVKSLASSQGTLSSPPFPSASAATPTGAAAPGPNVRGMFVRGDFIGVWMLLVAGLTGMLAVAL